MRCLLLLCVLWISSSTADAAEPILMPDFTPGTGAEFASTVMIQGLVSDRLLADGHIVLTQEVVAPTVGADAITNCSAQPSCPLQVLPKLPTRIAVVVRINRLPDGLMGHLELYEQSSPSPVVVRDVPLPPGSEGALANEVSAACAWLIQQVGPSSDAVMLAAARMIAGQDPSAAPPPSPVPVAPPVPVPAPVPVPVPVAQPQPPPRTPYTPVDLEADSSPRGGGSGASSRPAAGSVGQLGDETGVYPRHVAGSEENLEKSGLDPRDWVYRQAPHAGRVAFEVRAGLGLGDADRSSDIRVAFTESSGNEVEQAWYQEGPLGARRPRGAVFVGYAPYTFFDFGALLGLQYGRRQFTTGVARPGAEPRQSAVSVVDAVQLYLQPRIRGYLVPVGPAKPFLFTGGDIKVFDDYDLQQPENFSYPVPPGGVVGGWVGGGGLMLDPSPIVGFFFEASYTQHFGQRAVVVNTGEWSHENLSVPDGVEYTIGLVGGIQFRI